MNSHTDQYSQLEDTESAASKKFYDKHNSKTDEYFTVSDLDYFAGRLLEISSTELRGLPGRYGKYTFWAERKPDWQKPKLLVQKKGNEPSVLLDLEESSESLDFWYPSAEGRKILYGTSENGNEQTTIHIIDVTTGSTLPDTIPFAGFTDQGGIVWENGSCFIYPRMNGFSKIGAKDKWLLGTKLYRHTIGSDPSADQLVYGGDLPDTIMLIPALSSDKRKLYVASCEDELTHKVSIIDLETLKLTPITNDMSASFAVKSGRGKVYALTNYKAPRYRLLMCYEDDVELCFDDWDEVLPESDDILQDYWIHKSGSIVAQYSHNVTSRLNIYDAYGNQTDVIHIPKYSVVHSVQCSPENQAIYYSLSSHTTPSTHYYLSDTFAQPVVVWQREKLASDDEIEVSQEWAISDDGTKIPYFYIRKIGIKSEAPCIVYGYGGFNIAVEPSYLTSMRPWVESGGSIAIASLRGGSEFGEQWHLGGSMASKQNTFDDCAAVGEDIISKGLSNSEKIGVMGGSNGGLLVSAVTVQRPDLFRAGAALVPLTDMLEFYKHQVAEFWVHEYGDPRIAEQRAWIEKWSPYHYPIKPDLHYPAVYYETALHDARVAPFHAFKMVARLEAIVTSWKGPLLLRTMTDTGHQSSNLTKLEIAHRTAEYYAFFAKELGLIV